MSFAYFLPHSDVEVAWDCTARITAKRTSVENNKISFHCFKILQFEEFDTLSVRITLDIPFNISAVHVRCLSAISALKSTVKTLVLFRGVFSIPQTQTFDFSSTRRMKYAFLLLFK